MENREKFAKHLDRMQTDFSECLGIANKNKQSKKKLDNVEKAIYSTLNQLIFVFDTLEALMEEIKEPWEE